MEAAKYSKTTKLSDCHTAFLFKFGKPRTASETTQRTTREKLWTCDDDNGWFGLSQRAFVVYAQG